MTAPEQRAFILAHPRQGLSLDKYVTPARGINATDEIQEGGFAGTALAEQDDKFPFVNFPVYVIQDNVFPVGLPVGF